MDRRIFMQAGALAMAVPTLAAAGPAGDAIPAELRERINFWSDGLGLSARGYTALLQELAGGGTLQSDNYSNGGVIAELEQTFARLLGKEAAVFLPTGTLANHLAIRRLARGDPRVLVQADSHLFNDSGDGAGVLSGMNLVPLSAGSPTMSFDEVVQWVQRSNEGRVPNRVGVISIENPVRRHGHRMMAFDELTRICSHAREQGIRLHLDGARLFNLPLHTGVGIREHAALFDTVYVSLWKHFNAASGAMLAGSAADIEGLSHVRRMFGGSLPQAWPSVAPAIRFVERYEQDYADAWRAIDALEQALPRERFHFDRPPGGTSRLHFRVDGMDAAAFAAQLSGMRIDLPSPQADGLFGLQVNPSLLQTTPAELAARFLAAAEQ